MLDFEYAKALAEVVLDTSGYCFSLPDLQSHLL